MRRPIACIRLDGMNQETNKCWVKLSGYMLHGAVVVVVVVIVVVVVVVVYLKRLKIVLRCAMLLLLLLVLLLLLLLLLLFELIGAFANTSVILRRKFEIRTNEIRGVDVFQSSSELMAPK